MSSAEIPRTVAGLLDAYARNVLSPLEVVTATLARIADHGDQAIWIGDIDADAVRQRAASRRDGGLSGVPFAVKDNIDVAGMATTAACPAFARP